MRRDYLQGHIRKTYWTLRFGLVLLAVGLPVLLVVLGYFGHGIQFQESISHYYFALKDPKADLRDFPMRGWFVGIMCAIGSLLILYRGFSNTENWLLNIAGASAFGVALFPMSGVKCEHCGIPAVSWAHFASAALLFLCLAVVSWACSEETLGRLPKGKQKKFRVIYDICALGMVLVVLGGLPLLVPQIRESHYVFALEAFGVAVFAFYWLVKSREMKNSGADDIAAGVAAFPPSAQPKTEGAETDRQAGQPAPAPAPPNFLDSLRMQAARVFDAEPMRQLERRN